MEDIRNSKGLTEEEFLEKYRANAHKYSSVFNTTDSLILTIGEKGKETYRDLSKKTLQVLLVRRKDFPFINQWALPGGFVIKDEDLQVTAERELKEETNVNDVYMEQLGTYGDAERDPRDRIISTAYMALIDKETVKIKAGSDAFDAKWFDVDIKISIIEKNTTEDGYIKDTYMEVLLSSEDEKISQTIKHSKIRIGKVKKYKTKLIERKGIAFDHGIIIYHGVEKLKEEVANTGNTDIIFNLMPNLFSLADLALAHETILDKPFVPANLKRKVKHMVIETNEVRRGAGHNPPKLFKYNPDWDEELIS